MSKRLYLFMVLLCLFAGTVLAQTTRVTGIVISEEDGQPVIGASVLLKGTAQGAITDVNGEFVIPNSNGVKSLIVSSIGHITQEVPIKPGNIKITLKPDTKTVDEVVVTAMGMRRDEKTLGYAATTVKADNLDLAKSGSVMGGLSGKVAGVQISSAGNMGTSQKVIIRGISSLTSNSPLYIVDGAPINNNQVNAGPGSADGNTSDFGNGANDINSEDVESVTILKGASATALYGSRAANGVVMITTKKATKEKLSVTYDGSFTASNILRVMQTQDLFGQGWGSWDRMENGSWGPRLDGTMHEWGSTGLETPMTKPFSYVKHNLRNFYQTGFERNNNVILRYGNSKLGVVASYGNLASNGILPNDGDKYSRNTFSLRGYMNIGKFTFDMTMNYVRKDISRSNDMYMELLQHAVDIDMSSMKDYNDVRYNLDNFYTPYATNPYYMIDNFRGNYQDDRVYGRIEMSYELLKGLKATARLGGDFTNYRTDRHEPKDQFTTGSYSQKGGATENIGYFSQYHYNRGQIDATAMLNADYKLGDFSLNGIAGWNLNQRTYSYQGAYVNGLAIAGWYNLLNTSTAAVSDPYSEKRRLIGAFGQLETGYKDMIFLNLSARNDWSSTLPKDANSFFYGGANLSVIFTEMIPALKNNHYVNFLKARFAIGQTGNDADVYKTSSWYRIANFKDINSYYTSMPFGGVLGMTSNNTVPSKTLKPEITTEYEFGLSGNFFDNRLSLDFAYYNRQTKDQIISATLAPESGYTRETRNVGQIENQGVEIALSGVPLRTRDWEWRIGATFTKNNSKVKELWDGLDEYTYTSWRGVYYVLRKGHTVGEFRVPAVKRVTDKSSKYYGYAIVNNNGWLSDSSTEYDYLGSSEPDFTMGFNTQLKWKNLTFAATADWRKGGYMVSNTSYISHFNGNSTQTLYNERNSFIYPHSVKIVNGEYVENNIPVRADQMPYALGNYSYSPLVRDEFIIPKDFFRLREISLTYEFPKTLIERTPFQQVSIAFVGRNLLLFTPKKNNYVDPEVSNLGNDLLSEFGETTGTSSTRNVGVNLKVVF